MTSIRNFYYYFYLQWLEFINDIFSIIFSTHNMDSVEEICDHVALINKAKKVLDGEINEVRQTYASDIYEIQYDGYFNKLESTLSSDYKIMEVQENHNNTIIKVEVLNKNVLSNDIIKRFSQYGNINMFRKHLPKMEDIFIKVVGETNI